LNVVVFVSKTRWQSGEKVQADKIIKKKKNMTGQPATTIWAIAPAGNENSSHEICLLYHHLKNTIGL